MALTSDTFDTFDTMTITEIINDSDYWDYRRCKATKPTRQTVARLIRVGLLPATKITGCKPCKEGLWIIKRSDWNEFKEKERPVGKPPGKPNIVSRDRYPDSSGDWLTVKEVAELNKVSKNAVFATICRQNNPLPAIRHKNVYFVRKADWEAFRTKRSKR